jgi:hypothetical protein
VGLVGGQDGAGRYWRLRLRGQLGQQDSKGIKGVRVDIFVLKRQTKKYVLAP